MTQLWRSFGELLPIGLVVGLVVGAGSFLGFWAHRKTEISRSAVLRSVGEALLVVWGLCVALVTLSPGAGWQARALDLVPFDDWSDAVSPEVVVAQVGGNVVLFLPAGVLLAARFGWGVGRSAIVGLGIVTAIEVLQFVLGWGRASTVDDVIAGTVGVVLGAVVVVALRAVAGLLAVRRQEVA